MSAEELRLTGGLGGWAHKKGVGVEVRTASQRKSTHQANALISVEGSRRHGLIHWLRDASGSEKGSRLDEACLALVTWIVTWTSHLLVLVQRTPGPEACARSAITLGGPREALLAASLSLLRPSIGVSDKQRHSFWLAVFHVFVVFVKQCLRFGSCLSVKKKV